MLKVGLTGGYATGKTSVARELQRLGCHLVLADQLGHSVLQPEGAAYAPVVEIFGREILSADSHIDRKRLASIVFNSPDRLAQLNALVHPAVFELERKMLADFEQQDAHGIAVLEAAILIETGRYLHCDKLIVTTCDQETQIARGMKRDGISREEILARLERQLSAEEKRRYADFVIDTSGNKDDTMKKVQRVFSELKRLAEARSR